MNNELHGQLLSPGQLLPLIEHCLDSENIWPKISGSLTLDLRVIEYYIDKPWNWALISRNNNLTFDFICKYPKKGWNWTVITHLPDVSMEKISEYEKKYPDVLRNFWTNLTQYDFITIYDILLFPDKPWDWHFICTNMDLSIEFIEKCENNIKWDSLSCNRYLSEKIIDKYYERLHWTYISSSFKFTIRTLEKYKNNIVWYDYSRDNEYITHEIIQKYDNNIRMNILNVNIPLSISEKYFKDYESNAYTFRLVDNYYLNSEYIVKYFNTIRWSQKFPYENIVFLICKNPNISMDDLDKIIERYPKFLDFKEYLIYNPNVTIDFLKKYNVYHSYEFEKQDKKYKSYGTYKRYKHIKHLPLVKRYENKITDIFSLLCDDLIGLVLDFI
jgi:hypothetical protein